MTLGAVYLWVLAGCLTFWYVVALAAKILIVSIL